jgi:hypothetical protein
MRIAIGVLVSGLALGFAALALAQGHPPNRDHSGHAPSTGHATPYAGLQDRPIKALAQTEIDDLKAGQGMGLALAAELNDYPGPAHVLEHADALNLSADLRERTRALMATMRAEARAIGERIIAEEARLDRLFADRVATESALKAATLRIGQAQGELRATHLRYHIIMREMLSAEQRAEYQRLRGYRR